MRSKGRFLVTVGVALVGLGFGWLLIRGQGRAASTPGGQPPIPGPLGIPRQQVPLVGSDESWSDQRLVSALQSGDGRLIAGAIESMKFKSEIAPLVADAFCDVLLSDEAPTHLSEAAVETIIRNDRDEFRAALACALLRQTDDQIALIVREPAWRYLVQRAQHFAGLGPSWMSADNPAVKMRSVMSSECH
ncbi:MAG: hypothetical protein ACF8Q5_07850 [Phycisphaerales bacterium JB040]